MIIEPVNDRNMAIQIRAGSSLSYNIVSTYAPTANRDTNEKDTYYAELQKILDKYKRYGPHINIRRSQRKGTKGNRRAGTHDHRMSHF